MKIKLKVIILLALVSALLVPIVAHGASNQYDILLAKISKDDTSLTDISKIYSSSVVPQLTGSGTEDMLGPDVSVDDIKSATLTGPYPILNNSKKPNPNAASLTDSFVNKNNNWAVLVWAKGRPIACVVLDQANGVLNLNGISDYRFAQSVNTAIKQLDDTEKNQPIMLTVGFTYFMLDSNDNVSYVRIIGDKTEYPRRTYEELAASTVKAYEYADKHPGEIGGFPIVDYLFAQPATHTANSFLWIILISTCILLSGLLAGFVFLKRKRKAGKAMLH